MNSGMTTTPLVRLVAPSRDPRRGAPTLARRKLPLHPCGMRMFSEQTSRRPQERSVRMLCEAAHKPILPCFRRELHLDQQLVSQVGRSEITMPPLEVMQSARTKRHPPFHSVKMPKRGLKLRRPKYCQQTDSCNSYLVMTACSTLTLKLSRGFWTLKGDSKSKLITISRTSIMLLLSSGRARYSKEIRRVTAGPMYPTGHHGWTTRGRLLPRDDGSLRRQGKTGTRPRRISLHHRVAACPRLEPRQRGICRLEARNLQRLITETTTPTRVQLAR